MPLEQWMDDLYDASQMGEADRWAIEKKKIPSLALMERAGSALAHHAGAVARPGPVRVVCGKGNNGGDGIVAARLLHNNGYEVELLPLWPDDELSEDAQVNLTRYGGPRRVLAEDLIPEALSGSGLIIDAIFGTGFSGTPRSPVDAVIRAINGSEAPVVACDIPSGVDGSSGEVARVAVDADVTVTFHAPKLGHRIAPGKRLCGRLEVIDIGIPPGAPVAVTAGTISRRVLSLAPARGPASSKFSSGRVVVIGGSQGLTGAVCLASEAAMRAGAGYVQAVVPGELEPIFEAKLTEVMTIGVPSRGAALDSDSADRIAALCADADAVVLGSGLGRSGPADELARELTSAIEVPLVIDADGLRAFGDDLARIRRRPAPTVLTPHSGELAGLLSRERADVEQRRLFCLRELVKHSRAVCLLKGDDTIVGDAGGERLAVSAQPSPALATAGTGDVLAGTIAALIARGMEPFEAACAGVIGNVGAGIEAASRVGAADGVIARDVIEALPVGLAP